jgi:hypothetical protein
MRVGTQPLKVGDSRFVPPHAVGHSLLSQAFAFPELHEFLEQLVVSLREGVAQAVVGAVWVDARGALQILQTTHDVEVNRNS